MTANTLPTVENRLQILLLHVGDLATCRGCTAQIRWVKHLNGKRTPYDAAGDSIGVNHFITCPKAGQFKRGTDAR